MFQAKQSAGVQAQPVLLHFALWCFMHTALLTNWRFVATLHWASLSAPFFQQHLLTCISVPHSDDSHNIFNPPWQQKDYDSLKVHTMLLLLFSRLVMPGSLRPHGLLPARLLCPWGFSSKNNGVVAISFSRGSSQLRNGTHIFCIGRQVLYHWATRKTPDDG